MQIHKLKLHANSISSRLITSRNGPIHCNSAAMSDIDISPEFLLDLVIGIITVVCNILMLLQAERIFQRTR